MQFIGMILFDYLKLTAPRITLLVMMTGFTGAWVGSRGTAPLLLILYCMFGIGLASAGASVFNNYYDRDIDRLMKRTCQRPLPSGRLSPKSALVFGISLSAASFILLASFVNLLSAVLAVLAIFIYSYIYTVVLKRKTHLATEIGGISGALPPVIGWVAVRGGFGVEAVILFSMMFLWQPAHFWSLAMRHRTDYLNAAIPAMPLVMSAKKTYARSFFYILLLAIVSLLPYVTGMAGNVYLIVSATSGSIFLLLSFYCMISLRDLNRQIFYFSIIYLLLNFSSLAIDLQG